MSIPSIRNIEDGGEKFFEKKGGKDKKVIISEYCGPQKKLVEQQLTARSHFLDVNQVCRDAMFYIIGVTQTK